MKDCNNCKHHKQGEHPSRVHPLNWHTATEDGSREMTCVDCLDNEMVCYEPKEDLDFTTVTAPTKENPEQDPNGIDAKTPGAKLDFGKAPIMRGLLHYFPRACSAVSILSWFGARKYSWSGWESVADGENRYGDALGRHLVGEAIDGEFDPAWQEQDEEVLHATAVAWNSFARLELILRRKGRKQ